MSLAQNKDEICELPLLQTGAVYEVAVQSLSRDNSIVGVLV